MHAKRSVPLVAFLAAFAGACRPAPTHDDTPPTPPARAAASTDATAAPTPRSTTLDSPPSSREEPEDPAGSTRLYQGTLGASTRLDVEVDRDQSSLTGSCRYAAGNGSIALAGEVDRQGALVLRESHFDPAARRSVTTGTFTLHRDGHGGLAGTWTAPDGAKTFPVSLAPRGISAAPRATYLAFLDRYARFEKKPPLTQAEKNAIVGGDEFRVSPDSDASQALVEHGVLDVMSLYVADVNNDGAPDFVLVSKNSVSDHNDQILGVYDAAGDSLRVLDLLGALVALFDGGEPGGQMPAYRDAPFLEVTPKGTVFRMENLYGIDAKGNGVGPLATPDRSVEEHDVFLWRGGSIARIEHTRTVTPVK